MREPSPEQAPTSSAWAGLFLVCFLVFPGIGLASEPLPLGSWTATAAQGVQQRIEGEVERVIRGISVVYRPIARQLLRRAFQPCNALQIWEEDGVVAIQCDSQRVAKAAPDGKPVRYIGKDGRIHELSIHQDGVGLVQHVRGDRGSRTTRFARQGAVLLVDVTIQSPRLTDAIRYQMRYQ